MNEFSLTYIWQQGDIITRGVAFLLLFMSVMSWSVIVIKIIQQAGIKKPLSFSKQGFWQAESMKKGLEGLGFRHFNPFRDLVLIGHAAQSHHMKAKSSISGNMNISDWLASCMKNVLDDNASRLQNGLGILASVGSTAPFVGLLGTVWGIFHALQTISQLDQPDIAHVAGPVGEALVMTAFGLFVAIPAVLGFNSISRRNKSVCHSMNRFAHDLHAYYLTGSRVVSTSSDITQIKSDYVSQLKTEHSA